MDEYLKPHSEYSKNLKYWEMVRHFLDGKDEMQKYLRTINPTDLSPQNLKRNIDYKAGAIYLNVAARTRNALSGAVFRKDAVIELPPQIEYMKENADGAGQSLIQISKNLVNNIVSVGRHGILVDYPMIEAGGELTEEYVAQIGAQAKITNYRAESIVNWECGDDGKLKWVTLCEGEKEYRVLRYDQDGRYIQDIYEDDKLEATITPKKYDGSRWDVIPFAFVGSEYNVPHVNNITLLDIVNVSKGHYQNSADYEDFLHHLGPTFAATVPSKEWMDDMMPNGYNVGPRGFIPIPDGGTAMILQPTPTNAHAEAMTQKENQMILIGARLIESGKAAETAEAVRIRYSGENSILDNISQNCSEAIEMCLEWGCEFMGGNPAAVQFTLNRDFFDDTMTSQEIMAMIQLRDSGYIALSDARNKLRQTGYIEANRTDEEIDSENGAGI